MLQAHAALRLLQLPPGSDRLETLARNLREDGDPIRAVVEVIGIKSRTVAPQGRRLIEALHSGQRVMGIGPNKSSKTFLAWAYVLAWKWFALGMERKPDGDPRGCIVVLSAPRSDTVLTTSYRHLRMHAAKARKNGIEIPGYADASQRSVNWVADSLRWFMVSLCPQSIAADSPDRVQHAGSGLHHPNLVIGIEEGRAAREELWNTLEGLDPALMFTLFNATSATGQTYRFARSSRWDVEVLDAREHPNIVQRRAVVPGGMSHIQFDQSLRDPANCLDLGDAIPETKRLDFRYALAPPNVADARGPRPDGVPGHPDAIPRTYRPVSSVWVGQKLGPFPAEGAGGLFGALKASESVARHGLRAPPGVPDVVGVDAAGWGRDLIKAAPRWGSSCREIEVRLISLLRSFELAKAVEVASRCEACDGTRQDPDDPCPVCRGNLARPWVGSPATIPKAEGDQIARSILDRWGVERRGPKILRPVVFVDGSYGLRIQEALERLGATVHVIMFGSRPLPPVPGRRIALNERAAMALRLSDALNDSLVDLPADETLWDELELTTAVEAEQAAGSGIKEAALKLVAKSAIEAALGRSPDSADAVCLAAGAEPPDTGGTPAGLF
jgi:hypothetical protein